MSKGSPKSAKALRALADARDHPSPEAWGKAAYLLEDDRRAWVWAGRLTRLLDRHDFNANPAIRRRAEELRLVMVAYVLLWKPTGRAIKTEEDWHLNMTANNLCYPFEL